MSFASFTFLVFLAVVLVLDRLLRGRPRTWMLLAASYLFYGWWDWRFLGLIVLSSLVDFTCGRALHEGRERHRPSTRKAILAVSVVVNLGVLALFKYFGFFVSTARALLGELPIPFGLDTLNLVLPVGISFYTFQTMSYTIDVYRGDISATRRLDDFMLFVAFFPQLVAGPIARAGHLLPQIESPRRASAAEVSSGLEMIAVGYFYKLVLADNMAPYVNAVFHDPRPSGAAVLVATIGFALQIYGDFAGYSLIARGVARLLGIELRPNFAVPYASRTPSEFWTRWHISLSTWLRDYLYIPLGGNRRGKGRTLVHLMVTMLLGGLWHGASWTFVLWGGYHGVLLVVWRLLGDRSRARRERWGAARSVASWLVFFPLLCLGWLIFRAESWSQLATFITAVVTDFRPESIAWGTTSRLLVYALPVVVIDVARLWTGDLEPWTLAPTWARTLIFVGLFYGVVLFGAPYSAQFIYFQF